MMMTCCMRKSYFETHTACACGGGISKPEKMLLRSAGSSCTSEPFQPCQAVTRYILKRPYSSGGKLGSSLLNANPLCAFTQLWHAYLKERRAAVRGLPLNHPAVEGLNNTYERALVSMHKMPRVWVEYLELLMSQQKLTHTRHVFDRCLCSLPITQHDRIWALYLVSEPCSSRASS